MNDGAREIDRAVRRFKSFHGFEPGARDVGAIVQKGPTAGLVVGRLDGIAYRPIGQEASKKPYFHRFSKKNAPTLAVSKDGKQSYIVGGRYAFTDRGFVDQPSKGGREMPGAMFIVNPTPKKKGSTMSKKKHTRKHRRTGYSFKKNPRPFSRARAALARRSGLGGATSGGMMAMIEPAAIGGAAAFGIDYLWGQFGTSIPTSLQSGLPMHLAKAAVSIGLGMAVGSFAGKRYGALVAAGGVTVAAFNAITELAAGSMSADTSGGSGSGTGRYVGRYIAGPRAQIRQPMGYVNPGRVVA